MALTDTQASDDGSSLTIVNDTLDAWQCKLTVDQQVLQIITILVSVIGATAFVVMVGLVAAPFLMFSASQSTATVFGISYLHLVGMAVSHASLVATSSAVGMASVDTLAVTHGISDHLNQKEYNVIPAVWSHRYDQMPLSLRSQCECIKTVITNEHSVRVDKVVMRGQPMILLIIFSGGLIIMEQHT